NDFYFGDLYTDSTTNTHLALIGSYVGGITTMLASVPVSTTSGNLRLDVIGSTLNLYLEGNLVATVMDTSLPGPGGVGIMDALGGTTFSNFFSNPVISDNFTRPNSATLGNLWSVDQGSIGINNNQAATGGALAEATVVGTLLTSVDETATVTNLGTG